MLGRRTASIGANRISWIFILKLDYRFQPDAGAAGKKQSSKVTGFNGLKAVVAFCDPLAPKEPYC